SGRRWTPCSRHRPPVAEREPRHARRSRTLQRVPDRAGTLEAFGVQYGGAPGPQTRSCCGLRAPRSRLRGRGRDNAYHLESRAGSSYQLKYLQIRHKEGSDAEPRSLGVGSETEERVPDHNTLTVLSPGALSLSITRATDRSLARASALCRRASLSLFGGSATDALEELATGGRARFRDAYQRVTLDRDKLEWRVQ